MYPCDILSRFTNTWFAHQSLVNSNLNNIPNKLMENLKREKQSPIFHLPLKGSSGKVGLSRKMFSCSSVVKGTRKARGFAPFCPQLQFQAVGQESRRSGTGIHCSLHVLKCLGFIIIIIKGSKEVMRFLEVGRAEKSEVTSESSQNAPPQHTHTQKSNSQ